MQKNLPHKPIRPSRLCVFSPDDRPRDCAERCFLPLCLGNKAVLTEDWQAAAVDPRHGLRPAAPLR